MSSKTEFESKLKIWLEGFLIERFSKTHNVQVLIPDSNLSKLQMPAIKHIDGYWAYEFKPDVLGILEDKQSDMVELVFINRSTSALSLKEIGELYCYSKIAKPLFSFITSPLGLASDVALLLLDKEVQNSVLSFDSDRTIIIFKWDTSSSNIEKETIYPIEKATLFD